VFSVTIAFEVHGMRIMQINLHEKLCNEFVVRFITQFAVQKGRIKNSVKINYSSLIKFCKSISSFFRSF